MNETENFKISEESEQVFCSHSESEEGEILEEIEDCNEGEVKTVIQFQEIREIPGVISDEESVHSENNDSVITVDAKHRRKRQEIDPYAVPEDLALRLLNINITDDDKLELCGTVMLKMEETTIVTMKGVQPEQIMLLNTVCFDKKREKIGMIHDIFGVAQAPNYAVAVPNKEIFDAIQPGDEIFCAPTVTAAFSSLKLKQIEEVSVETRAAVDDHGDPLFSDDDEESKYCTKSNKKKQKTNPFKTMHKQQNHHQNPLNQANNYNKRKFPNCPNVSRPFFNSNASRSYSEHSHFNNDHRFQQNNFMNNRFNGINSNSYNHNQEYRPVNAYMNNIPIFQPNTTTNSNQVFQTNIPYITQGIQPNPYMNNSQGVQPNQYMNNSQGVQPNPYMNNSQGVQPNPYMNNSQGVQPNPYMNNSQGVKPNPYMNNSQGVQPNPYMNNSQGVQPNPYMNNSQGVKPNPYMNNSQGVQPNPYMNNSQGVQPNPYMNNSQGVQPNNPCVNNVQTYQVLPIGPLGFPQQPQTFNSNPNYPPIWMNFPPPIFPQVPRISSNEINPAPILVSESSNNTAKNSIKPDTSEKGNSIAE